MRKKSTIVFLQQPTVLVAERTQHGAHLVAAVIRIRPRKALEILVLVNKGRLRIDSVLQGDAVRTVLARCKYETGKRQYTGVQVHPASGRISSRNGERKLKFVGSRLYISKGRRIHQIAEHKKIPHGTRTHLTVIVIGIGEIHRGACKLDGTKSLLKDGKNTTTLALSARKHTHNQSAVRIRSCNRHNALQGVSDRYL